MSGITLNTTMAKQKPDALKGWQTSGVMSDRTDALSQSEIDRMLKYCLDKERMRDYLMILTLYRTGRRISELVGSRPFTHNPGLRPIDIQDDGLIEWSILKKNPVRTRYNDKRRRLKPEEVLKQERLKKRPVRMLKPVDDYLLELLRLYIQTRTIPPYKRIFCISRQRADQIIKMIAEGCNLKRPNKKIHVHQLRHSLAINFLKKNPYDSAGLVKVKQILEHSTIDLTEHYSQFTQQDLKDSLNKTFNAEAKNEKDKEDD